MSQNSNKCRIVVLYPIDDIKSDGTAKIWWFKDGSEMNVAYTCKCIYKMFNSEQLFDLIFRSEPVYITKSKLDKHCTEIKF